MSEHIYYVVGEVSAELIEHGGVYFRHAIRRLLMERLGPASQVRFRINPYERHGAIDFPPARPGHYVVVATGRLLV